MLQSVGRYKILSPLGKGAMGVVYLADDPVLNRQVAVKTIDLSIEDPGRRDFLRGRLLRDARAAAALAHPNIVSVFDVVVDGETAGIIMEYVAGENLASYLSTNPTPEWIFTLQVVNAMAAALDYTHSRGIIHRDIKPANVMLDAAQTPKITDFGIARITEGATATMPGMVMGTIEYMAPEQIKGETVDGRADQFALGIVAYRMLTGQTLFGDQSLATLAYKIVYESPAPVCSRNGLLPQSIDPVLSKVLAKDPNDRYRNCSAFAAALSDALTVDRNAATLVLPAAGVAPAMATPTPTATAVQTATMAPLAPIPPAATTAPSVPMSPIASAPPAASRNGSKPLVLGLCGLVAAAAALAFVWKPWAPQAPAPVITKSAVTASSTSPPPAPAAVPTPAANVTSPAKEPSHSAKAVKTFPAETVEKTVRPGTVEPKTPPIAPTRANAAEPAALSADDSLTRGRDLMKSGDYKGAIQAFGRAIDLRPNWAQAYHGRGNAYEAIEQYDAALHDYSHAVLLNPIALFLSSRATCYIKMGNDEAALADLNKAIAMNTEGPGMRIARAGIYIRRTEFRQALPDLDEALRVNPDSIIAHRQRAVVRRALGDRPGAQLDVKTANRLAAQKSGG